MQGDIHLVVYESYDIDKLVHLNNADVHPSLNETLAHIALLLWVKWHVVVLPIEHNALSLTVFIPVLMHAHS